MDDNQRRLLESCKRHPEDRTMFQVLADYLEEHGDPRSELIRLEVGLADLDDDDLEYQQLIDRQEELIARHQDRWEGPLLDLECQVQHSEGFVQVISARTEVLLGEQGCRLLDWPGWLWVDSLLLRGPTAAESWQSPLLASLSSLTLKEGEIGDVGAQTLAGSPYLANLTDLDLECNQIGDAGAQALGASPYLANLTMLNLQGNSFFASLPGANTSGNWIGDVGTEALARSPYLSKLTWLDLEGNRIGDAGAQALAGSLFLPNLKMLNLRFNQIGDAGAMALGASPYLARLTYLWLRGNQISEVGAWALVQSPYLTNLTSLHLQHNPISEVEAQRLRAQFGDRIDV